MTHIALTDRDICDPHHDHHGTVLVPLSSWSLDSRHCDTCPTPIGFVTTGPDRYAWVTPYLADSGAIHCHHCTTTSPTDPPQ